MTDFCKSALSTSPQIARNLTEYPTCYKGALAILMLSEVTRPAQSLQVHEYLEKHNLITSEQFGFRCKLSTNIALTQMTMQGNTPKSIQQNGHWSCFY